VTITAAGVNPVDSHLDHPVTVKFVNRDSAPHRPERAPKSATLAAVCVGASLFSCWD
jgi:hypothetical protein